MWRRWKGFQVCYKYVPLCCTRFPFGAGNAARQWHSTYENIVLGRIVKFPYARRGEAQLVTAYCKGNLLGC